MSKTHIFIASFVILIFSHLESFEKQTFVSGFLFNVENQSKDTFHLKEGDLLFQDSDCGPFCEAVEKVTFGINNANFSHIGLVVKNQKGELVVLEAISKGVILTTIDSFLNRSFDAENNPKIVVGRIKSSHSHLVGKAVNFAKDRIGKPYDEIFDIENDKYYCSELIYFAFKEANNGQAIFQLQPMTFNDPDTKQPFPIWVDYYKNLGQPIPESEPGLNPGSISRSEYLEIIYYYGKPDVK